jgi:ankyrin repeat protein
MDPLDPTAQLKQAIDREDLDRVITLMYTDPKLHRAPLGYGHNGPLTWVAECRVPFRPPSPARLDIARWMLENGSDVHQGGDGPLMRAALRGERIPMMELLVAHGADVNAAWNGHFPILFAPCESVDPVSLAWLLTHGADPNGPDPGRHRTALDYLIGSYHRSPKLADCIDLLRQAGGTTRYLLPGVLATIQNRAETLAREIDADPTLVHRRYPALDCGSTGARRLLLTDCTLLHVAAEYGSMEAARLLLDRGADVNAPGGSGQTPVFHAVTQFDDAGLPVLELLLQHGADLSVRAALPGHYERPDEVVECTALGYAIRFPGEEFRGSNQQTVHRLRQHGAPA